tara:strand:+ start:2688 stop:4448 length:1761 start_codon:yes stop_codon:yes gene_type:complete
MKIKLSDYVISYLKRKGIKTFFAVSGGASLHLINSVNKTKGVRYICNHHEQAAACAADGYARAKNHLGCAIATSGPGATNLITGIASSYFDSVPVVYLTGQTSSKRSFKGSKVRQIGFQETNIVDIAKPITKYSVKVDDPYKIKYYLDKAIEISLSDRKGPVLVDIPDDFQFSIIDTKKLIEKKVSLKKQRKKFSNFSQAKSKIENYIKKSKRPVLIMGWGAVLSNTYKDILEFSKRYNIPYCLTWAVSHLGDYKDDLYFGTFGTHGNRHSNIALEKADLLISLGTRMDTKATGSPVKNFSKNSKKIIFDIDLHELEKFKKFDLKFDLIIQDNLKNFSKQLKHLKINRFSNTWKKQVLEIKNIMKKYDEKGRNFSGLNPYKLMNYFSDLYKKKMNIICDTGCIVAWINQEFKFNKNINLFHDYNNTAMGWALPASIGSYFFSKTKTVCFVGDGSLMFCLNELATVQKHQIPIVLFIVNNNGYSMIRQTQDQWFDSDYFASDSSGGISFPNFQYIARSFNIEYRKVKNLKDLDKIKNKLLNNTKPLIVDMQIPEEASVVPQVKYGYRNFEMEPIIPSKVMNKIMKKK